MKILITGTAGFIGYHFARKCLDEGFEVVSLDNINSYYSKSLKLDRLKLLGINIVENKNHYTHSKHTFYRLSLEDYDALLEVFKTHQFDAVCHLAAQAGVRHSLENPFAYVTSNLTGFVNILECIRLSKIDNFVFASSSSVYGLNEKYPFDENDSTDHPVSLYGATKKSNEIIAHSYSQLFKIQATGLRFFTVYGPWGRPDMALFKFVKSALNNEEIKVFNNGDMSRDFTYIDDIVEGIFRVIKNPAISNSQWDPLFPQSSSSSAPYRVLNIGSNSPVSLNDFIHVIESELSIKIKKKFMKMQPGDVKQTYANVSRLNDHCDYSPTVKVRDGVKKFIEWYKEYYV